MDREMKKPHRGKQSEDYLQVMRRDGGEKGEGKYFTEQYSGNTKELLLPLREGRGGISHMAI